MNESHQIIKNKNSVKPTNSSTSQYSKDYNELNQDPSPSPLLQPISSQRETYKILPSKLSTIKNGAIEGYAANTHQGLF